MVGRPIEMPISRTFAPISRTWGAILGSGKTRNPAEAQTHIILVNEEFGKNSYTSDICKFQHVPCPRESYGLVSVNAGCIRWLIKTILQPTCVIENPLLG